MKTVDILRRLVVQRASCYSGLAQETARSTACGCPIAWILSGNPFEMARVWGIRVQKQVETIRFLVLYSCPHSIHEYTIGEKVQWRPG